MSRERGADYYDDIYSRYQDKYNCHYTESEYYPLWKRVMELLPKNVGITELGCGTGQFGRMLMENDYMYVIGYDFSLEAIRVAKEYNKRLFEQSNIMLEILDGDLFIALEVMEHVRDIKLLESLPLGKEIVFTVPDFNDESHVRYFRTLNEVVNRYNQNICFQHVEKFHRWYICKGTTW